MKKLIAILCILLVIYSCSKKKETELRPVNTDTTHVPVDTTKMPIDTSIISPDSAQVLGTWYNYSSIDSLYNQDGTYYETDTLIRDTTLVGFKDCNYITFGSTGYYLSGVCSSNTPSPGITYYAYVSPDSFSETYGSLLTGQHDSIPFDTTTIKDISATKLSLRRIINITNALTRITYRDINNVILTR